jgi:hypothetical protein
MWRKQKMKKVLAALVVLCLIGVVQADLTVDGATFFPTNGWMNWNPSPAPGGTPGAGGGGWGVPALRQTGVAGNLLLQTNVNASDDNYAAWSSGSDLYWLPGAKTMEALGYTETYGLKGQNVTFNFVVGSNNLGGVNGYVTEAFIKTLDAGGSWATTQQVYESLTVGAHSLTLLNIDPALANPVVQIGFRVVGGNDVSGSATAGLGALIVPEPLTMALLGLGGLFLRRRK